MLCCRGYKALCVATLGKISYHSPIAADIPAEHSKTVLKPIKCWKMKAINIAAFKVDIKNSDLIEYPILTFKGSINI